MLVYQTLEGQDADGTRGQVVTWAELEPSDVEQISEQIMDQYEPGIDQYIIVLYSEQFGTEHQFDVLASDYFTPIELQELDHGTSITL